MSERAWISPNRYRESYNKTEEVHNVAMLRWDVATLAWVKWTGNDSTTSVAIDNLEITLAELLQESQLISNVDEASATVTYVGKALAGSSAASAVWRIYKYTISGNVTTTTMAGGSMAFANVWDNRAALVYS